MSSDNSDKTVFRKTPDAQAPRADSTVIRPTPGRRSGQAQAPRAPDATQLQNPGGGQAAPAGMPGGLHVKVVAGDQPAPRMPSRTRRSSRPCTA